MLDEIRKGSFTSILCSNVLPDLYRIYERHFSWTYDGFQVNLINAANSTDLSNYVANGEWDLVAAEVERNVVYYSCCQEPYPDVTYHLVLRRRPLFYGELKQIFLLCAASLN